MKRILLLFFSIALVFSGDSTIAADDQVQICALNKAFECAPDTGCIELSIAEMALPRFIRIDQKAKTLESLDKNVERQTTKISTITKLEEMTILQGTEQRGWSIALGKESGNFMLSIAGEGEGFVVFGFCMKP
ncbi:MAG: hypothetical protein JW902_03030 [Syntrophaceae bacterium]|nr:hypothetical protein [Syntrophaceae bacterium]